MDCFYLQNGGSGEDRERDIYIYDVSFILYISFIHKTKLLCSNPIPYSPGPDTSASSAGVAMGASPQVVGQH